MKTKRRDFLKVTGAAGLGIAGGGLLKSCALRAEFRKGTGP